MNSQRLKRGLRRFLCAGLCIVIVFSMFGYTSPVRVSAAPLSLTNPGFEDGMEGWTLVVGSQDQVTIDSTIVSEGLKSLKIADTSKSASYMVESNKIAVNEGYKYTAAAKFYQKGRTAGYANISLVFYNADHALIPISPVAEATATYLNNAWTDLSVSRNAPDGAAYVSIRLATTTSYVSEGAYFDAVSLDEDSDDYNIAESDSQALQIGFAQGDNADTVRNGVELPTAGMAGSTIAWDSSHPEIITADGTVLRPSSLIGDQQVTLTAIVQFGSASVTKLFPLTVLSYPVVLTNAGFETGDRTGWRQIAGSAADAVVVNTQKHTGSYSIKFTDNSPTGALGVESERLEAGEGLYYTASSKAFIEQGNFTIYLRFYAEDDSVLYQNAISSKVLNSWHTMQISDIAPAGAKFVSVVLSSNTSNVGISYFDDIELSCYKDTEILELDKEAIEIGFAEGDSAASVTADLTLPTSGRYSTISWSSDNEQVIAASGSVSRPSMEEGDAEITLTAAVSANDQTVTRTFTLIVRATGMTTTHVNLPLVNAGFEDGLAGWTMIAGTQSTIDAVSNRAYAGQKSLLIADSGAAQAYTLEGVKELAAPDITYSASAQFYQLGRGKSYAYFYLYFYDSGNNLIETKSATGPYSNSTGNNWTPVTITATAPAGTRFVSLGVGTTTIYTGQVWIDDVQLEASTQADNTVISDNDAVGADAGSLSIRYIGGDSAAGVSGPLGLPVVGAHDTLIAWSSSHEHILSRTGVINRPEADTDVTLTARITRGGRSMERAFSLKVMKKAVVQVSVGTSLQNSGFSDGINGWEQLTGDSERVSVTNQGYNGPGLEVNSPGTEAIVIQSSAVRAEKKKEYTASAKAKINAGKAHIELRFYDAAGNLLTSESSANSTASGIWQDLWVRSVASVLTNYVRVIIWADAGEASHFTMDEVMLSGGDFAHDNRGFEGGTDGWLIAGGDGSVAADSTKAFKGETSLKLQAASGGMPSVEGNKLFATPGELFTGFSKVFIDEGTAVLSLNFYDESEQLLQVETAYADAPLQGWTSMGIKAEAPANANYVSLTLSAQSDSIVWFDETYVSKEFTYLGVPIFLESIQSSAYGKSVDGRDMAYTVGVNAMKDNTHFVGVDLETSETVVAIPLSESQGAFSVIAASDGNIYVGSYTDGRIYKYVPGATSMVDLGIAVPGQSTPFSMADGGDGVIYGGTYDQAYVFKYTPGSGFSTISPDGPGKRFDPNEDYVRGIAVDRDNHALYAGIGSHAKLVRYDLVTGQTDSLLEEELTDKTFVYHLKYTGGKLFATTTPDSSIMVLDISTDESGNVSVEIEAVLRNSYVVSDAVNGKVYYITADKKLNYYDIASKTQGEVLDSHAKTVVPGITPMTLSIVQMTNQTDYPGYSVVGMGSVHIGKTGTFVYNLQTGKLRTGPADLPAAGFGARSLLLGSDGGVYSGNHLGGGTAVYYPLSGEIKQHYGLAQIENGVSLGDKIYFGTYTSANLMEYDPSKPWDIDKGGQNPRKVFELKTQYQQDRPFGMAAGDGLVFMGTVPDYGVLGGAIAIYEPETDEPPVVVRNIVQDQSIVALEYADGILYGGSSVWGGLGVDPTATSAKFFAYDPFTHTKLFEMEIQEGKRVITSLVKGPDGNIWGMCEGHVFIYNPQSNQMIYNQNLIPEINYSAVTSPVSVGGQLIPGDDGYMYGNTTGKLFRINPETMQIEILRTGGSIFIEKDDVGNIYFSDFTGLVRYSYMDSNAMLDSGLAAAKLHADAEANVIGYSGGDHAGRVTQNVVFAANGVNGSIISWESDHPEYISNSGVVVRPAPNAGNVTVDIRATFELNGLEQKKLFRLTVIAEEAGNGNGNNGGSTSPENPVQQDNDQIKVSFKGTYVDIKADDLIELLEGKSKILVASNSEAAFEFSLSESQIKEWLRQWDGTTASTIRFVIEPASGDAASALQKALKLHEAKQIAPAVYFKVQFIGKDGIPQDMTLSLEDIRRILMLDSQVDEKQSTGIYFDPVTGQLGFVPTSFAKRNGKKAAIIKFSGNQTLYTVAASNKSFDDIAGHWAAKDITLLANKLIVNGIGNNKFAPEQGVKRAEFAALIVRALGLTGTSSAERFTDVQSNTWYAQAVSAAVHANIIQGYEDGSFRPNALITREEIAVMLVRAMSYIGLDRSVSQEQQIKVLAPFTDTESLSWSAPYLAAALQDQIVQGKPGNRLDPKGVLTRAEMVVMLKRFLTKVSYVSE